MSSSIGQNVTLLFEQHQSKVNSLSRGGISTIPLFKAEATSKLRNSAISSKKFYGKRLKSYYTNSQKFMASRRFSFVARAVLATDPSSQNADRYNLDGDIELQVLVSPMSSGCICKVEIVVTNSHDDNLVLHWGGRRDSKEKWVLPSRRPEGTKVHKDRALRTPFQKSGSGSSLNIEIDDPAIQAIEFLVFNEARNIWFKNNGQNFNVRLPGKTEHAQQITVPEDLVQIQAYLRWERKGKQMYTPEQEKEEYEAARAELIKEVAKGASIQELQAKLRKGSNLSEVKEQTPSKSETPSNSESKIPDDLIQIQSYIRWERAGKPNYSVDEQSKEFEEARKELQMELDRGASLDDLRNKIAKGEIKTKVAKQLEKKRYFSAERIQRKKRDLMQIINKHVAEPEKKVSTKVTKPKASSAVELFAEAKEAQDGVILKKRIFELADKQLLVLVTKLADKTKIYLATDFREPLILHWALSREGNEWLSPPEHVLPPGSVLLEKAAETQFVNVSADDPLHQLQLQTLQIEIEGGDFVGMPFVLVSSGNWIKDNGSDFYIDIGVRTKQKDAGDGSGTAKLLLEKIASLESEAQKSFMHRFNIAADLLDEAMDAGELGLAGILVWMRFMATRQLIWNKNYNVKPREISKAQDRLTDSLQNIFRNQPQYQELLRMIMSTVGRGGEGDVGQRIRDEILVIQRNNNCKGGMMEEWHQKLHNNTSPDDVVICQALIDYIKSDFDIGVYWNSLNENGITKDRLLSYDRAIHSEPSFRSDQKEGLLRDLGHYMRTLKAVHSGADLEAAISNCMGYKAEGQGFMVGVNIDPVPGLPAGYPDLLQFVLEHVEDKNVEPLLEALLEARQELRPLLFKSQNRLKDLIFLDIALDSSVRTVIERGYEELSEAGPEKIMYFISMVMENLALSSGDNEDLVYCLKGWDCALNMLKSKDVDWALYAKSVLDRTRLLLASKAELYQQVLQPSADYLGSLLGVDQWAVSIFTEEMIRAGSAASLSALLNRLDPVLRKTANLGSWQIISPVEAVGYVVVVNELLSVQNKSYSRPTILVANHVKGEEEIPDGTVAVLTPDMPDVLSHVSVRARNCKVCFATCFDSNIFSALQAADGRLLRLQPTSSDVHYSEVSEDELKKGSSSEIGDDVPPSISLVKKKFGGKYAIASEEFTSEMVGAKSRNISYLKGKVPPWVGVPTSVALPFGAFEEVLSYGPNKEVNDKLQILKEQLDGGDVGALGQIRRIVLELVEPPQLVEELKNKMKGSGMPWPGDEGEERWQQAWTAIKKVWASKWNERAYFSTRKVGLDHEYLCMAVLVQEIVSADYAFVIHTTNPSSGDSSEIYAEVVKGLGETLVGAYPGRALSFISKKSDLNSLKVLGYPSKPIGLFIRQSIIFRSDSNGEDLEGYAGAGLYDSVPMDEEEKIMLDYSVDPLIKDSNFRQSVLSSIAKAGSAIEELYSGSPQDIEGVVKDGKIFVVQTRPQMMMEEIAIEATEDNDKGGEKTYEKKIVSKELGKKPLRSNDQQESIRRMSEADRVEPLTKQAYGRSKGGGSTVSSKRVKHIFTSTVRGRLSSSSFGIGSRFNKLASSSHVGEGGCTFRGGRHRQVGRSSMKEIVDSPCVSTQQSNIPSIVPPPKMHVEKEDSPTSPIKINSVQEGFRSPFLDTRGALPTTASDDGVSSKKGKEKVDTPSSSKYQSFLSSIGVDFGIPKGYSVRPPVWSEPSDIPIPPSLDSMLEASDKTFTPVFDVNADESLDFSFPEAGCDLGYRLLEPLTLPHDRAKRTFPYPGFIACHDMARAVGSVVGLTKAYWAMIAELDKALKEQEGWKRVEMEAAREEQCFEMERLKKGHAKEIAALQLQLKDYEVKLEDLKKLKQEMKDEKDALAHLKSDLEAANKDVEKAHQTIKKLSEQAENVASRAVKEYKSSDAFARYLTLRYDGGWIAAKRCAKSCFPDLDWNVVEDAFDAKGWANRLAEDDEFMSDFHIGNVHPADVGQDDNTSP